MTLKKAAETGALTHKAASGKSRRILVGRIEVLLQTVDPAVNVAGAGSELRTANREFDNQNCMFTLRAADGRVVPAGSSRPRAEV